MTSSSSEATMRIVGLNHVLEYFEVSISSGIVVYCSPFPLHGTFASLVTVNEYAEYGATQRSSSSPVNRRHAVVFNAGSWEVVPVAHRCPDIKAVSQNVIQAVLQTLDQPSLLDQTIIIHEIPPAPGGLEYCRFFVELANGKSCLIGLYDDEGPCYQPM